MHRCCVAVGTVVCCLSFAAYAQITNPIPDPIPKGTIRIDLEPIATGLNAPIHLTFAPDGTDRQFILDQRGEVLLRKDGVMQPTPFLDVSTRLVPVRPNFDERGLLGLAFHPGFANPASPGFRTLYTYTSEPLAGPADFTVPLQSGTFDHQGVLAEWKVDAVNPDRVDITTRREVMRWDEPQFNHDGGHLQFGSDGKLYMALGDGGGANDTANGHTPGLGNGQDTSNILGTILRIDVDARTSANGQYGVPADNPFVGQAGVDEIWAYGMRNPYRFTFHPTDGRLLAADVGQRNIEELNDVVRGGNYGWNVKEGTFIFDPATGNVIANSPGLPAGLIDPILQYDHDEGITIIGGLVYRGSLLPQLQGKYVFADFSRSFGAPDGRLFYADLDTGEIKEFILGEEDLPLGYFVKGMGEDADGELYVLAGLSASAVSTSGVIFQIVPEPATMLTPAVLAGLLLLRRRSGRA